MNGFRHPLGVLVYVPTQTKGGYGTVVCYLQIPLSTYPHSLNQSMTHYKFLDSLMKTRNNAYISYLSSVAPYNTLNSKENIIYV